MSASKSDPNAYPTPTANPVVIVHASPSSSSRNTGVPVYATNPTPVVMSDGSIAANGNATLPLSAIPSTGKVYIRWTGYFILAISIALIIASAVTIQSSSGYYIGGIYVGIIAFITACTIIPTSGINNLASVGWVVIYSGLDLLVCFIGVAVVSANFDLVESFEACANYSSTLTDSCNVSGFVHCYGDSDYYAGARSCELNYIADNSQDLSENYCTCVSSNFTGDDDNSGTCYNYDHMRSCDNFLNDTANNLATCISLMVILLFALLTLFTLSYLSRYHPERVKTRQEEIEEREQNPNRALLSAQYVTSATPAVTVNAV